MSGEIKDEKVMKETGNSGLLTTMQRDVSAHNESEDTGAKEKASGRTAAGVVFDVVKVVVSVVLVIIAMEVVHRFMN